MKKKITVPDNFVQFAKDWHDGQTTVLYGVASTGQIPLGFMYQLYNEIEPRHVYDSIGDGDVTYEDFEIANQFVIWTSNFLTDAWWEEKDRS